MAKRIQLREMSTEEQQGLERLSRSRTAPQRQVERARIVLGVQRGERVVILAQQVGRSTATIYNQVQQFNARGLDFLEDLPRSGRPETYSEEARGQIIVTAKTHPQQLGQAFGYWTLDRLTAYVNEQLHIPISRSQIANVLEAEGVRWYQEKTYFTERPDPQFAQKRGRL
jgi:transposase